MTDCDDLPGFPSNFDSIDLLILQGLPSGCGGLFGVVCGLAYGEGEGHGGDDLDRDAVVEEGLEAPLDDLLLSGCLERFVVGEVVIDGPDVALAIDDYAHD